MSKLQPEEEAWGSAYLALLGAAFAQEADAAYEMLAAGLPPRSLRMLYPLGVDEFSHWLAACSPSGSRNADLVLVLQYTHGNWTKGKLISTVYLSAVVAKGGFKADQAEYKVFRKGFSGFAAHPGGHLSSLRDAWQLYHILLHWPKVTFQERGQLYSAYTKIAEVLGIVELIQKLSAPK